MQAKDYLTLLLSLLALLVSFSTFFVTYRRGGKADVVEAATRVVEAATRKKRDPA
jgi:hypothetical protein